MGDAGSLTLGFTLCFLLLHFWQRNPVWNPAMHNIGIVAVSTLIIPLFDVTRVTLSRLRDHRPPFMPDKNHIHHKLMRSGMTQYQALLAILGLAVGYAAINFGLYPLLNLTWIIVIDVLIYSLVNVCINQMKIVVA